MKKLIVTNQPRLLPIQVPNVEVVSSREYLSNPAYARMNNVRVFNLSNEYRYQSKGYYVSLLAEARGHKVVPNVKNIQDLKVPTISRVVSDELDGLIQHSLRSIISNEFILSIYFGKNVAKKYNKLSHELHMLFQAPLMRAKFTKGKKWQLASIRAIPFREVPDAHLEMVQEAANTYFSRQRYYATPDDKFVYDLAILVNPNESAPPSNQKALQNFIETAEDLGFSVELITKDDYHRIGEFDALFIRETTSVNHHTYRFARRAQSEGLVVIDDPDSILRCTNKVYLAELIQNAKLPAPKTMVVHSDNTSEIISTLGLPVVLKLPDAAFSIGVKKAANQAELDQALEEMLSQSDLVIAQAYTPTDYDWRIGVLDGKPLYACKYFMAKGHWQIYNWSSESTEEIEGNFQTLPADEAPAPILEAALSICKLIGNGLYGVDIKETEGKPMIIEVNDNPSIDAGIEDQVLGKELYSTIIKTIRNRLIVKTNPHE